jgi:5-carboxymethyl-2-hydroxymuconate isomerase
MTKQLSDSVDAVIYQHFAQACAEQTVNISQMIEEHKPQLKKIFSDIKFKGGKLTLIDEYIESVI